MVVQQRKLDSKGGREVYNRNALKLNETYFCQGKELSTSLLQQL